WMKFLSGSSRIGGWPRYIGNLCIKRVRPTCLLFDTAKSSSASRQQSDMRVPSEPCSRASFASILSMGFYICTGLTIDCSLARGKWRGPRKKFFVTVAEIDDPDGTNDPKNRPHRCRLQGATACLN